MTASDKLKYLLEDIARRKERDVVLKEAAKEPQKKIDVYFKRVYPDHTMTMRWRARGQV